MEERKTAADVFDIDRTVGGVIDAYTLAPNDEETKREAVKQSLQLSVIPLVELLVQYGVTLGLLQTMLENGVASERKRAAEIAKNGCLVPPDGGCPTEDEVAMCDRISAAILGDPSILP